MASTASSEEVTIVVEEKEILCDKDLLTKECDYFRAMFESCMIESQTNTVILQDQDHDEVLSLINCIKYGHLKIHPDTAERLTETAVMLQIPRAIESCCSYFIQSLNDSNCLQLARFAQSLSLDQLYSPARRHSLYYFMKVYTTDAFCSLSQDEIVDYLSDKHINCDSELDIVDAVDRWLRSDKGTKETGLRRVLDCVQCGDLREDEWEKLECHRLVTDTQVGADWFKEMSAKGTRGSEASKSREVPVCFLTVGGVTVVDGEEVACTDICKFDETEKQFKAYRSLCDIYDKVGIKMGFQVTVVGKDMYITGGQTDLIRGRFVTDVWRFDGFEHSWKTVTTMPSVRRHHGSCGSDTDLFLLGGFGRFRDLLDSFQRYNTITGDWEDLPSLPCKCFSPLACYVSEKIYVSKHSISCFDLQTYSWTKLEIERNFPLVSYIPHVHCDTLYEFPLVEFAADCFFENEESAILVVKKSDLETKESTVVSHTETFQFGGRVFFHNDKFYTVNLYDNLFVQGSLADFHQCNALGDIGKSGVRGFLVAVPDYPFYKCYEKNTRKGSKSKC